MPEIYRSSERQCVTCERGATLIEATVGILAGLFLILLGIDLIRLTYVNFAGNYVVNEAARWSTYGETLPGLDRIASIKSFTKDTGDSFGLKIEDEQIHICPTSNPDCIVESAGGSQQFFTIRVTYPVQLLAFFREQFSFGFEAVAKNEPF